MTSLAGFISGYRGIRLATPEDNARILEFFDRAAMQTSSFDVQYRRAPDFFRLLRYQGARSHVFIGVDADGEVQGVASLTLRPGWVNGVATTVGYLGDLRVGTNRRIIAMWRAFYGAMITSAHEIDELADCTAWFTVILDANTLARRALGSGKSGAPRYVELGRFTMRNLVARLPGARHRIAPRMKARSSVRSAGPEDLEALTSFFEEENRTLALGFRDELGRRLREWDGLELSRFVIVREGREIIACFAPWSPSAAKETTVSRVPTALALLGRVAARLASGWIRVPAPGEPLRVGYLTHLTFARRLSDASRAAVFRAMLDFVFDDWSRLEWHCVAVADFEAWGLASRLRGYLQQPVPITIYGVVAPDAPDDAVEDLRRAGPPAFEMAIV